MIAHNIISERVIQIGTQVVHVQIDLLIGLLCMLLIVEMLMLTRHVCMMMLKLAAALSRSVVLIHE